jgi:flagellar biosynthetic protein FliO
MWEQTLAVFIVLGLLLTSLWLLRRKGFARVKLGFASSVGGARRMELVERMPLTPHHSLHLVRVDDRLVLIGVSPQSCASVESFPVLARGAASSSSPQRQGS